MKKAVIVCILVAVLACVYMPLMVRAEDEGWPAGYPEMPRGVPESYYCFIGYTNGTTYLVCSVQNKFYNQGGTSPSDCEIYNWNFCSKYKLQDGNWVLDSQGGNGSPRWWFAGSILAVKPGTQIWTDTDYDTPFFPIPMFGDAEVVITSPIDLYQDNVKRWKLRSVLAINDVEGGFDTSKISYVLEFYSGQLYAQAELVSVTYWEIQDELYIMTEEDRVVNMKTFEFEPPASRGKARVICLYDDEVIATAEVRYHRYSGFVDEDGDGLDDRTGLPDHSNESDYELIIEMPQKPEDGDLLAWIQYIAELFGYVIEMAISVLKDLAEGVVDGLRVIIEIVEPMFSFVEQFFASMPAPMSAAMIALVTVSTVLGILKLLRG